MHAQTVCIFLAAGVHFCKKSIFIFHFCPIIFGYIRGFQAFFHFNVWKLWFLLIYSHWCSVLPVQAIMMKFLL